MGFAGGSVRPARRGEPVQRVDSRAARSYHRPMPMWRCPHCATPQAETARCWVCHRSSTACGACRHFRRAVAGQLGYCGLDRQRRPLRGDEIRPCWEAADAAGASPAPLPGIGAAWPLEPATDRTDVRPLQFVEVQPEGRSGPAAPAHDGRANRPDRATAADDGAPEATDDALFLTPARSVEPRWSLWGDVDT